MPAYMLNLVFSPGDLANNGRFLEYDSNQSPLARSKAWLVSDASNPSPDNGGDWQFFQTDDTALRTSGGQSPRIFVRFQRSPADTACRARMTIVCARNRRRQDLQALGKPVSRVLE
jgi:hypothetical protein